MRRVLIGTPLKGNPTLPYLMGIAETLRLKDAEYLYAVVESTYVQSGRQKLVSEARRLRCDELLFIDSDIGFSAAHVQRLRSHREWLVSGLYAKRNEGEPQWAHHPAEQPTGDLLKCYDVPAGFLHIDLKVFDRLDAFLPQTRRFQHDDLSPETEYFPVGLTEKGGWRHPLEKKLEDILSVLRPPGPLPDARALQGEIMAIIGRNEHSEICGEDVSFSRLCYAAGMMPLLDTACRVEHHGQIAYPAKRL